MKRVKAKTARRHRAISCQKCFGAGQYWSIDPLGDYDDPQVHHTCKCPAGDKFKRLK